MQSERYTTGLNKMKRVLSKIPPSSRNLELSDLEGPCDDRGDSQNEEGERTATLEALQQAHAS